MHRALLTLVIALTATTAGAGVIRHDVVSSNYTSLAQQSQYDSVGDMIINGSTRCSGSAISSNFILTAAHCVDGATNAVSFSVKNTVTQNFQTYQADDWAFHSSWNPANISAGFDIALVYIAAGMDNVAAATLYTGGAELGEVGTNVGYGRTGTGLTGDTLASGTRRAGNNMVDLFGSAVAGWNPELLLQDFDNPNDPADNLMGSSSPLALEYLIAPGDSGGGLFIEDGGTHFLAGVHSFLASIDGDTDADYGDLAASTRVSAFTTWISDTMEELAPAEVPLPGSAALALVGLAAIARRRAR